MIKIAVANQKGGVGKTTISFNLASILADQKGSRVLAVDNDPQGNLTSSFLEDTSKLKGHVLSIYDDSPVIPESITKNLSFLGASITLSPVAERDFHVIFKLKEALDAFDHQFDYCIIDSLPSFGHLHLAALNAADYILIPITPSPYPLDGMSELISTIDRTRKYFNPSLEILGIIINQLDGRKLVLQREMEESLRDMYGDLVFKTRINKRIKIEESPTFQTPITLYDPDGPSVREFNSMATEILRRLKNE